MKLIKLSMLGILASSAALFSFSDAQAAALDGWLDCFGEGHLWQCTAVVSGGTPPYSYSWTGTSAPAAGDTALYLCTGSSRLFKVTVNDAASGSITLSYTQPC